ncbi:vacuolar protein sorting-associated protein VTA1 homolog [Ischnura elegans]|uniref:vacuolar protein sorting-associated protein VTA1 homolog n=1 Tax=Ischnura elegans TaxID=197161 RepID=UPI001ED89245|nr:vacuolar protein sorting-associated protein VTA1 homolog [Ischnura elegans]
MPYQFPPCPPSLKPIQHYLKTAAEHDDRDVVVSYWCRVYALETALGIDKKSDEARKLLSSLMDWLETQKTEHKDNEAVMSNIPGQAHIENYALKLFVWADSQDRAGVFNKNVVKAFYTSGMLFDVLNTFGELTEEVIQNRKYAKWKAAYIHNCLKNGETPIPGPQADENEENNYTPAPSGGVGIGFVAPPSSDNNVSHFVSDQPTFPSTHEITPPDSMNSVPRFAPPSSPVNPPHVPPSFNPGPVSTPEPPMSSGFNPVPMPGVQLTDNTTHASLNPEQIGKAQKYCKWASSALNYDDIPTAIGNLQKALRLLQTGQDVDA